jgi:RNA polymerase sigma-70 factor (ECF subfamily)
LLHAWSAGDQSAFEALTTLVYDELKRLARVRMAGERPGHTLQATALVHEAFVKLVAIERMEWKDRAHFYAISARLMRRILVDFARARHSHKRGAAEPHVPLDEALGVVAPGYELIAVDEALQSLASFDARKSQVVELRFFGGFSVQETADTLNVSPDTVMRDWKVAKAWLSREMGAGRAEVLGRDDQLP